MTTATWIPIDPKLIHYGTTSKSGGVETFLAPSPYDLPDAVSVESDADRGLVTIRFRYLEPERADRQMVRKDMAFYVGRYTQRLHGIEMTITNVKKIDAIKRAIQEAISVIASNIPAKARRANYRAARDVVESTADELARYAIAS